MQRIRQSKKESNSVRGSQTESERVRESEREREEKRKKKCVRENVREQSKRAIETVRWWTETSRGTEKEEIEGNSANANDPATGTRGLPSSSGCWCSCRWCCWS